MASRKGVEMKIPASVIGTGILCLFSTIFLAIGLELPFDDMRKVKCFLWVNSVDNVLFCSSTRWFGVVPEKSKHGKNQCPIRIVDNEN